MTQQKQFTIENIGPIDNLTLPIPEGGGVVVLRGRSGTGKSTALQGIQDLKDPRGKVKVTKSDWAKSGVVTGPGVKMTVSKSTRKVGELEVESLDSKLDLSDIIDPGIKDEEKADRRRIKALVSVTGAELDQARLVALAESPEEFDELTEGLDLSGDSLERAAIVKRAFEASARNHEGLAEQAEARAASYLEDVQEDPEQPVDSAELQAELEQAIREQSRLKAEADAAVSAAGRAAIARRKLDHLSRTSGAEEAAEGLERARKAQKTRDGERLQAERDMESLEQELAELQAKVLRATEHSQRCHERYEEAVKAVQSAERLVASVEQQAAAEQQLREQIESAEAVAAGPEDEVLAEADARVISCRRRIERNAQLIALRERAAKAKQYCERAELEREEAERLRKAAAGCEELLSDLVGGPGCPLRVLAGRLVLPTDRGDELFCELSDGERADVAIEAAVPHVGEAGIAVISQRIWQDLEPQARQRVAETARKRKITIFTAEVTGEDGIRAEVLEETVTS